MAGQTEDRERRIAERRERAHKRVQFTSSINTADSGGQPTSCGTEKPEENLQPEYINKFSEIVEASSRSLQEFKEQSEAISSAPSEEDTLVAADLSHLLREAAAQLDDQSLELEDSFSKLHTFKNPMVLRNQLQTLTRQAAAAERAATEVEATAATLLENKASHFVHMLERQTNTVRKAINVVEQRCMTAATAMAEQASTAETALLQQLATSHETRRAAIAAEIEKAKLLEYALHEERVNKRQAQEKVLEEMRKKEHAGHDELWHQLSSQATELALELSLAKHDQLFTADKLGYNVRVLGERNKENKEVLTQLQRNVHKQKALLAGLRSQYAEEKSSTSAAQDKFKKDAEHACQSLNSLKDKALHFEIADEEELRQLVAFKEERLSELVGNLKDAQMKICQLCGAGLQACFCEIKLPPPPSSEGVQIDEALNEAHWREKLHDSIPEGLHQELKMLEAAVRQDL